MVEPEKTTSDDETITDRFETPSWVATCGWFELNDEFEKLLENAADKSTNE